MRTGLVVAGVAALLSTRAAQAQDEETRVEQMLHAAPVAARARSPVHRDGKPMVDSAWIGKPVRVETVDHGLYLGILQAVTAQSIIIDMALPHRALRYSLRPLDVASVRPVDAEP